MDIPVTVIIPAYQAERYIAQSIESISAQTYAPQEILVVNDGSTDKTVEVIKQYPEIRLIENDGNLGICHTLNNGIAVASQPWIAFLDADDTWHPQKLEKQWAAITEMKEVAKECLFFTHLEQFISPDLSKAEQEKIDLKKPILPGIAKVTLLAHQSAFDRVGAFDTQWKIGDFIDWYVRAKELGLEDVMLDQVLARRRIHTSNMGRQFTDERKQFAQIMLASIRRRKLNKQAAT